MRDNPFLGQYTKDKEMRDEVWKVVSMVGNGMMTYQGDLPMEKPIRKGDYLLGCNVNRQDETGKRT
jgi:hypothetical protein